MLEKQGAECHGEFREEGDQVMRGGKSCEGEVVDASQELEDGQAGLRIVLALE